MLSYGPELRRVVLVYKNWRKGKVGGANRWTMLLVCRRGCEGRVSVKLEKRDSPKYKKIND